MKPFFTILLTHLLASTIAYGQTLHTLKVGPSTPLDPSAILEVQGTTGALLVPRMTSTQRLAITPTNGDIVYDTTVPGFELYANGAWQGLGGSVSWGSITGTLSSQTDLQNALNLKANLASPTFTGTVTAPTFSGALSGNASTASALAATPSGCTSGQYADSIASNGNLTCAAVNFSQLSGSATLSQFPAIASDTLLGNNTGGSATPTALSVSSVVALLGDVTTMGSFGSSPNANGGSISSNTLTLQPASSTQPGGVSTTTQTFAGSKTLGASAGDTTTIGAASSTAVHQINGGVNYTTRTITNSVTVDTTTTDYEILANCSATCNITLPAPTNGRELIVVDINGQSQLNNIILVRHGSEQINGVAASYTLAGNAASWAITSDGTNWYVKFNPNPTWAFGAGTDGAQSVTSSTLTAGPLTSGALTRDAYWSKLTMGAAGVIKTSGFKIFAQVCDFSAAITGAITATGGAGGNGAAATTGGSAGALPYASAGTLGVATVGIIGGAGGATTGTEGATAVAVSPGMGGPSGAGAIGGTGTGGAGGAARAAVAVTTPFGMPRFTTELIRGITLGQGGGGAPGGSGAGGNSTAGGGGGGGGSGGGVVYVACGTVIRGTNSNASIIQAIGGAGGNGGTTVTSGAGGGSGGPGGGGGMIYFIYAYETGSAITNGLDASGGLGGSGGNATGGAGTGGDGAGGGGGGRIDIFNVSTGIGTEIFGGTATTGNAHSSLTGGGTKAGQVTQANL